MVRWFAKKVATPRELQQLQQQEEAQRAREERKALEDAWRKARNNALPVLHAAERAHKEAQRVYKMYAPGPEKILAGETVNRLANGLLTAQKEFAKIDHFDTWAKNQSK